MKKALPSDSLVALINAEVPASVLTRIRDISPRLTVVSAAQLVERPEWLAEAEILYTHHVPPERVASAQNLKWVQTLGAGVEWLLTPEIRRREDLIVTNTSGIHAQPIAEHVFGFVLMFAHQLHRAVRQQLARDC
jgi:D-2-hydroxyacid dehydrogenase (NADP+)